MAVDNPQEGPGKEDTAVLHMSEGQDIVNMAEGAQHGHKMDFEVAVHMHEVG
jgi:hypothetical protein